VAKSLRPKSISVCEAACSAVLHQKSFATASSFLVSESVTQETVSSHKQSTSSFFVFSSLFSCLRMGKKRSLSEAQRAQIVILRQKGYTERAISEHLAVSKTAVHQTVVKFKNCGPYSDCKWSGRPRKTTRRDNILIKRCVVKFPTCSAKKIRAELGETGSRISRRTISRRLTDEFGLKSRKLARSPRLNPAMNVKRLQFAKKCKDWTSQQWSRVLFSDETTILLAQRPFSVRTSG